MAMMAISATAVELRIAKLATDIRCFIIGNPFLLTLTRVCALAYISPNAAGPCPRSFVPATVCSLTRAVNIFVGTSRFCTTPAFALLHPWAHPPPFVTSIRWFEPEGARLRRVFRLRRPSGGSI